MGLKSLTLQIIPWCFHVFGVGVCGLSPAPARVIGSDGRVRMFNHPVPASELMNEHPLHLLCRSDAFFIGQKVSPLSASERLQPGQSYLLLPSSFFHSALSFVSLILLPQPVRPLDIRKTEGGTLQVRVTDEFLRRVSEDEGGEESHFNVEVEKKKKGKMKAMTRVCTTEALKKDYQQLVRCKSRQWKPKLETIREHKSEFRRRRGGLRRVFAAGAITLGMGKKKGNS